MLEKTLNRIMEGAKTPEGKIIAILVTLSLALMTWNSTSIKAAFAQEEEGVPAASDIMADETVDVADQVASGQEEPASAAEAPAAEPAAEPAVEAQDDAANTAESNEATEPSGEEGDQAGVDSDEEEGDSETVYPAVILEKSFNGIAVTIDAPEGALPEGAQLTVSSVALTDEQLAEKVEAASGKTAKQVKALKIELADADDNAIQPKADVTVKFEGANLEGDEFAVYRINDDESIEAISTTAPATASQQMFTADELKSYVVAGLVEKAGAEGSDVASDEEAEELPAQTITGRTGWTVVRITAPEGSLPEGAQVVVSKVDTASVAAAVEAAAEAQGKTVSDMVALDVTITDKDGNEIQPLKPVSVQFVNVGVSGDDISVYHVADDKSAATEVATDMAAKAVQSFEADGFSIYVVTGGDQKIVTVNFYNGNELITSEYVKKNSDGIERLYSPGFDLEYGQSFFGWATDPNATTGIMDIDALNTSFQNGWDGYSTETPVNYFAVVKSVYVVTYYRYDDSNNLVVLKTVELPVEGTEEERTITVWGGDETTDLGNDFEGWVNESTGETLNRGATLVVSDHLNLYLKQTGRYWLIFDSNAGGPGSGATYIPPQLVWGDGAVTVEPEDPTRAGYKFLGWNESANGTGNWWKHYSYDDDGNKTILEPDVEFGDALTSDITLYAQWEGDQTTYYVIYWKQVATDAAGLADGDKSYIYESSSEARTAKTGDTVYLTDDDKNMNYGYYFTYNSTNSDETATVAANGSTKLNAYYDRREITYTFNGMTTYEETTENTGTQYGLVDGEYVELTYDSATGKWMRPTGEYTDEYTPTTSNQGTQYAKVGDEYYQLTRISSGSGYYQTYTWYYKVGSANNGISSDVTYQNDQTYYRITTNYGSSSASQLYYRNNRWRTSNSASGNNNFTGDIYQQYTDTRYALTPTPIMTEYEGTRYTKSDSMSFTGLYGAPFTEWPIPEEGKTWNDGTYSYPLAVTEFNPAVTGTSGTATSVSFNYTNYGGSTNNQLYVYGQKVDGSWAYDEDAYLAPPAMLGSGGTWRPTETYTGFTIAWSQVADTLNTADSAWSVVRSPEDAIYFGYYYYQDYGDNVYLRYSRNQRNLQFVSDYIDPVTGNTATTSRFVDNTTGANIYYGASLKSYEDKVTPTNGKPGYVFVGWYADEAGNVPFDFNTTMPDENVTVYAKWETQRCRVVLVPNAPAGSYTFANNQALTFRLDYEEPVSDTNITGDAVSRPGYMLDGWYTDAGALWNFETKITNTTPGVVTNYQQTADWINNTYGDNDGEHTNVKNFLRLTALWKLDVDANSVYVIYKVGDQYYTYGADGSVQTVVPVDGKKYIITTGENSITFRVSTAPTKYNDGYTFENWILQNADGSLSDIKYKDGNQATVTTDYIQTQEISDGTTTGTMRYIVLEAGFSTRTEKATTITFNGNGGNSGGENTVVQTYLINQQFKIDQWPTFARAGYDFDGWNTQPDGNGFKFNNEDTYAADRLESDEDMPSYAWNEDEGTNIVYATWKQHVGTLKLTKTTTGNTTPDTAQFTISSVETESGESFTTTVPYSDIKDGNYSIEVPTGIYMVTESGADVSGYTLETTGIGSSNAVTVEKDGTAELAITNTYTQDTGNLTFTKSFSGTDLPEGIEFTVKSTDLEDEGAEDYEETVTLDEMTEVKDDEGKVTGYTWTAEGVLTGDYEVTESGAEVSGWTLAANTDSATATVETGETAALAITNTYTRDLGTITVTKAYGAGSYEGVTAPDETEFTIKGAETNVGGSFTKTATYADFENETYTFTDIPTGDYTITESGAEVGKYTLTVDNNKSATVEKNKDAAVTITNTYTAKPAKIGEGTENEVTVTKKIEGATSVEAINFKMALTSDNAENIEGLTDGAVTTSVAKGIAAGETETAEFGELTFNAVGEYTFEVTETSKAPNKGWTYDGSKKLVTVTVTNPEGESAGQLVAAIASDELAFTNTYKAWPASYDPSNTEQPLAKKTVAEEGDEGYDSTTFNFTVEEGGYKDAAGNETELEEFPMPDPANGSITFDDGKYGTKVISGIGNVTFSEPGTYTYTITESKPNPDYGWDWSEPKTAEATVVVKDDGEGQLYIDNVDFAEITNTFTKVDRTESTKTLVNTDSATGEGTTADSPKYKVGDTAYFEVAVTNKGTYTRTNLEITEQLNRAEFYVEGEDAAYTISADGKKATITSIAPEETVIVLAKYEITQADIDNGDPVNVVMVPDGNNPEVTIPTEDKAPEIEVTKTADKESYKYGDTVNYTITVENKGNVTVSSVAIVDELEDATVGNLDVMQLAPGEKATAKATYVVSAADAKAGSLKNVVNATASDPDKKKVEDSGDVTVKTEQVAIEITGASDSKVYDGTALTNDNYKQTSGDLVSGDAIESVKIEGSQTLVGESANVASDAVIKNAAGDDVTAGYDITYVPGTLKVTDGTGEGEEPVDPSLVVTKDHEVGTYGLGDMVTFTITATNIYDEAQTITLSEIEGVTLAQSEFPDVAAGATIETTATYTITEADILAQEFTNTVTAKVGNITKTADDTVTADEMDDPNPSLSTIKETTSTPANGESYALGETITYKITVTNDGNLTISNVEVDDELTGLHETVSSLEPGDSREFTTSYTVTEDDILAGSVVNEATADGDNPSDDPTDPGTGTKEDPTDPVNTAMDVNKKIKSQPADGEAYKLGETIEYSIDVTNMGNVAYHNVKVEDQSTGFSTTIGELAVGETQTFTTMHVVDEADIVAGSYTNTVTAAGDPIDDPKDPENPKTPEGEDSTTTGDEDDPDGPTPPIEGNDPSLSAEKTSAGTMTGKDANGNPAYAEGDTLTYKVTVTNDGNLTVTNIKVVDEKLGYTEDNPLVSDSTVAPGETITILSKEYTVTAADVEAGSVYNVATVTGETKGGEPDPVDPKDEQPVEKIFTIIYDPNGGNWNGSTDLVIEKYRYGTVIDIYAAPTREGFEFDYWFGSEYQPGDKYTVVGDHTFVAQWKSVTPPAAGPVTKTLPQTGDDTPVQGLALLSLLSLAAMLVSGRKLRREED